jgi:small subunit ribosomal protein S18
MFDDKDRDRDRDRGDRGDRGDREGREGKGRRRPSPLADPTVIIDYKNPSLLRHFISDRGKIVPARVSGVTAAQQRQITKALKRARSLALIPYSVE